MEDVKPSKPATQGVGVNGISSEQFGNDEGVRWYILVHLPKFQMYAVEVAGIKYGHIGNVMEWITGWMQDCINSNGEKWLFDAYSKWHDDKGYWTQEDVYGNILNEVENGNS